MTSHHRLNRPFPLAALGLALAATLGSGLFAPLAAQERTLVLSAFGVGQNELRKELYAPFEAKCKCKIVVNVGNSADRLAKMEARKANPEVDVAVLADFSALEAAQKDLIEPIDTSRLKNFSKLHDFAKNPIGNNMGVGYTYFATSIVYRTDKVKIDSWKDLSKPELKGRLALPNITTTQGPTTLMMIDKAYGGTTPNLATGIQKVSEIKGGVVTFYERSAQLVQLFQQDEIHAAVIGRFNWPLIKKLNMPIAWATPKEGLTGGINVLVVTKNSKNKDLAYAFIDEWLSAEAQTRIAMALIDSPVNKDVKLPKEVAEVLTYGADTAKALNLIPPTQQLLHRKSWVDGWNAKIASK
jgi:putative spermidine/putrescine transport system substrate-binding protein